MVHNMLHPEVEVDDWYVLVVHTVLFLVFWPILQAQLKHGIYVHLTITVFSDQYGKGQISRSGFQGNSGTPLS